MRMMYGSPPKPRSERSWKPNQNPITDALVRAAERVAAARVALADAQATLAASQGAVDAANFEVAAAETALLKVARGE